MTIIVEGKNRKHAPLLLLVNDYFGAKCFSFQVHPKRKPSLGWICGIVTNAS